jgi:hypothetical protein
MASRQTNVAESCSRAVHDTIEDSRAGLRITITYKSVPKFENPSDTGSTKRQEPVKPRPQLEVS